MKQIFKRKKTTLEDLLTKLTVATEEYTSAKNSLEKAQNLYDFAEETFLKSKQAYELALSDYITHGEPNNAKAEADARKQYGESAMAFSRATNSLNSAKKRVKKAEKIYIKLQELVSNMQPQ